MFSTNGAGRLSRRQFGASVGLASAAGALLPSLPVPASPVSDPADETNPEVRRFLDQDPSIRYLGQPVNSQIGSRCPRTGFEDDRWVVYQVFKGSPNTEQPATFVVADIATGEVLRALKLPTAEGCFDFTVASDGRVYIGTYFDYQLWRYDPATKQIDALGDIDSDELPDYVFGAGPGPDGLAFLGTYKDSRLHSVDPTGAVTNHGTVDPDATHIHFVCWDPTTDAVFCATGSQRAAIWRIDDLGKGTKTKIVDGSTIPLLDTTQFLGMLDCVEGRLVARSQGRLIVTDLSGTIEYFTDTSELTGYHVVPTLDRSGFIFSTSGGALRKYDFATASHSAVEGSVRGFLCHAIEISEGVIVGSDEGGPFTHNYLTGERSEQQVSFRQPTKIQKVFPGPGASLYASGYMSGFAQVNTTGGEPYETVDAGQYESWMVRDDMMYLAGYGHSTFSRYDPSTPTVAPKQLYNSSAHKLDRPFAMAYNADRDEVYVGSVGGYGVYQGGLSIHDFATGKVVHLTEEIAKDQSIISAVYNPHDKLLYIGTSIDGGMGIDPTSVTPEGQLVVFDPATREVVSRTVPVPGREGVTGLLVDPDGSVWGVAEEQLIKVAPSGEVQTFGAVSGRYGAPPAYTWAWAYLNWSALDHQIYGTAGDKFFRIDPATGTITQIAKDGATWGATDAHGDVYFAFRTHLFKYLVPQPITGVDNEQKCLAIRALQEGRTLDTSGLNRGQRSFYDKLAQRVADGKADGLEDAYCVR